MKTKPHGDIAAPQYDLKVRYQRKVSKLPSPAGKSLCCQIRSPRYTASRVRLLTRAWPLIGSSRRICRRKLCGWPTTSSCLDLAASRTWSASGCPAGRFSRPDRRKPSQKPSNGSSATRSQRPKRRAPRLVENLVGLRGESSCADGSTFRSAKPRQKTDHLSASLLP